VLEAWKCEKCIQNVTANLKGNDHLQSWALYVENNKNVDFGTGIGCENVDRFYVT
jgi:hypothetical protein